MLRWLFGLGIGAAVLAVVVNVAGGVGDAAAALRDLDRRWLVPAASVEAASYALLGLRLRRLVGADVLGGGEAVELGLVVAGFGLLTPASPAEGLAIAADHLHRRGLGRRRITIALAMLEWFSTRVFLLLASLNLLAMAAAGRITQPELRPLVLAAAAVLLLLLVTARLVVRPAALASMSAFVGWFHRADRRRSLEERRARGEAWHREVMDLVGPARRRAALAVLTAAGILADVGCLWFALRAVGARVGFDVAVLAVTVAAVSVLVPLIPGGLGIVEAAIPAIAHRFGVPYTEGLAAAILYRTLSTLLPAALGALSIIRLRLRVRVSPGEDR